jgi:phosphonate transport system permease protein
VRRLMELLRAVPEVVWGLVLIAVVGVGPVAGAWALGIHSAGCLARLFGDCLENAPLAQQRALASTGASRLSVFAYGAAPLAAGPMAAHALFRFEWNLRMATVLGVIGAGGVGQALYEAQQLFFYRQMLAYIVLTWLIIATVDRAGELVRRRYGPTPENEPRPVRLPGAMRAPRLWSAAPRRRRSKLRSADRRA